MSSERTIWQLARFADVHDPDSDSSPGAEWLRRVESAAEEMRAENPEASADDLRDSVSEWADGVVPIYTHNRWQVFVDLCAYEEDVSELGAESSDLTSCAGVALYLIAERLLTVLLIDDDDDEEQES